MRERSRARVVAPAEFLRAVGTRRNLLGGDGVVHAGEASMARAGVRRMRDTHTVARRRSPLRAVGRGAAHVLIAALPALAGAAPLASEAGRLPVAILSERAEDERREDLPDPLVALDLALDAIAAPALILGSDGRILRANAVARSTLAANAPAVRRALALVL